MINATHAVVVGGRVEDHCLTCGLHWTDGCHTRSMAVHPEAEEQRVKSSDIADQHVIDLAQKWHDARSNPGVVMALVSEGVPEKLALTKVERLVSRGYLDYGTSAYHAWPTGKQL